MPSANHRNYGGDPYRRPDRLISRRPYKVSVVIAEVFFRRRMGKRYFNGLLMSGCVVGLIILRFLVAFMQGVIIIDDYILPKVHLLDGFIILFVLFSLGHFIGYALRDRKEIYIHSYYMGDSRFFFIARGLRIKKYRAFTYRYIEPFMLLLLVPFTLQYHFIVGLLNLLAVGRLWYENSKALAQGHNRMIDFQDRQMESQTIPELEAYEPLPIQRKREQKRKPSSSDRRSRQPTLKQPPKTNSEDESIEDLFNKLDPNLRNLGNDD